MNWKTMPFAMSNVNWQDYRATNTGMVVFYNSDPVSELAIREVPEDIDSPVVPEPHYESGTYGLYSCARPKVRSAFVKNKVRYLFFVTKYEGTNAEYRGKTLITGYYHVVKTADARRFHIRFAKEYECLDVGTCLAFLSDEVHFVSLADSFELTDEVLKTWNYNARVNRQTRIILDAAQTRDLLEFLKSKPNAVQTYLDETRRLLPHGMESDEEDEDEGEGEVVAQLDDTAEMFRSESGESVSTAAPESSDNGSPQTNMFG